MSGARFLGRRGSALAGKYLGGRSCTSLGQGPCLGQLFVTVKGPVGTTHQSSSWLRYASSNLRHNSTVASVDLPLAKQGKAASEEEKREFLSVFPDLVHDLTDIGSLNRDIPEALDWYAKVLQYNTLGGKLNRGLAVGLSFKLLAPPELVTPENMRKAHILGWCIEMLQSFFLIADDIMDCSEMRRGKATWHTKDNLGLSAYNDASLMENGIYKIMKKYFSDAPYYVDLLELFHEMTHKTCLGQSLDLLSCPPGERPNLSKFTMLRYNDIIKYKTAYYSFYLPVALSMYMVGIRNTDNVRVAGITDRELHRQARTILVEMGQFFQVQDDYLDCFGNPADTGKSGLGDIAAGKCTWLSVVALQRASQSQRALMEEHYGRPEAESAAKVKALYKELGLPATYKAYEDSTSSMIRIHIQQISRGLNHNVFFKFLDKIHKRKG